MWIKKGGFLWGFSLQNRHLCEVTKAKLIEENAAKTQRINALKFELERKDFIIAKMQKMLFGATSEKSKKPEETLPNQMDLFAPQTPLVQEDLTVKQTITYQRSQSKKRPTKRIPLPVDLPRIPIVIEPDVDTTNMVKIDEEVTEILDIIPPVFQVIQIIRPKYAHPKAATQDVTNPIVIAPMPSRVIDKGVPSTRLLAYIIIGKFIQHLPYYRQIQIFQRIGVNIKSNTINGWMERICVLLKPLYEAFCKQIFSKSYLQADETTVKVLKVVKKNKKGKAHTGYFWVYYDPLDHHVVFIFNPGRGRIYPAEDLKNFAGTLQTDGLNVYDAFDKLDHITLVACMAHIRRKFVDALNNDKKRVGYVVNLIGELYEIEAIARKNNYTAEQRQKIRQEKAKPIMAKLKTYLQTEYESGKVLPKSAIGQAIQYALGRWKYQERYLDDGNIEIDNNWVENAIRPIAIGRKNYLFAGSEKGAQWAAIFYTLLGSALRHGHNPLEYFSDILRRLPDTKMTQLHQLFPKNWKPLKNGELDLI